jgi:hypothetical protein
MLGDLALIAYPADYGVSGIRTFIVNHRGAVYEKHGSANRDVRHSNAAIHAPGWRHGATSVRRPNNMTSPLEIEFQNTRPIETVEFRIRRELAELEKFYSRLVSCQVQVELPEHERRGSITKVRIDFGVPTQDVKTPPEVRAATGTEHMQVAAEHQDAVMAVHAAFNAARRQMEELIRTS